MSQITWQEFQKVELRIGTILSAEVFAEALKPAYIIKVDFGKMIGVKKSSAQITDCYQPKELVGKQVLAVVNFAPKQIGPIMSECLITGFHREDGAVVLAAADQNLPNGTRLA